MEIDLDFTFLEGTDFEADELPVSRCSNRKNAGRWEETKCMSSKGSCGSKPNRSAAGLFSARWGPQSGPHA